MIDILIPALGRPDDIPRLAESLPTDHRVVFICSPLDMDQIEACRRTNREVWIAEWEPGKGDFAKKINWAYERTDSEWLFQGATDIRFHEGWDRMALRVAERSGKRVIGTNDLHNPQVRRAMQSTHTLFARSYIEAYGGLDDTGKVFSEAYDHQFCNPPEAPIWMADTSFKSLDEVRVGDEVMGWERGPATEKQTGLRRLKLSTVVAKRSRWSEMVRVELESGRSLRCTPDHLWLNPQWNAMSGRDGEYAIPKVGRYLSHVVEPLKPISAEHERLAGWLGGIFDGEGSGTSNPQIGQSLSHNPAVYNRICETLAFFDIPFTRAEDRVWLIGGRYEWMRFLHIAQPTKRIGLIEQVVGSSRFGKRDRIVAVEPDVMGEVMSLETTTGNYVAWGYASRNCDVEFTELARKRGEWAFAKQAIVEHLHPHWGLAEEGATYKKAMRSTTQDYRLYMHRMGHRSPRARDRVAKRRART